MALLFKAGRISSMRETPLFQDIYTGLFVARCGTKTLPVATVRKISNECITNAEIAYGALTGTVTGTPATGKTRTAGKS